MDVDKKDTQEKARDHKTRRRWRFWTSLVAGILLTLLVVLIIALPLAVEWAGEHYLKKAGALKAEITNVDLNLFTGRLSVLGLDVEGSNGDRVSFDRFEADADILPLVKKRGHLSSVTLEGLTADIRQLPDGTLTVGGLQVPASTTPAAKQEEKEPVSWGFGFNAVDLYDLQIHVTHPQLEETVTINHFLLKDFATWVPEGRTALLFDASALGGDFHLSGTADPLSKEPSADIRYSVRELPLDRLNPYLDKTTPATLTGEVTIRGEVDLSFHPDSRSLNLQTSLTTGQVSTALDLDAGPPILWKHGGMSLEVNVSYTDTGTVAPDNLSAKANLAMEGVHLASDGKEDLLKIGSLKIKDLDTEGTGKVKVDQIALDDIILLSRPETVIREKEPSEVVRLADLTITGINLENRYLLHVSDMGLDSLTVWILLGEDKKLEPVKLLPVFESKVPAETPPGQTGDENVPEPAMDIAIDRISLSGQNSIVFRDLDVKPPLTFHVDSLQMEVSDLDTNPSTGHAALSLEAGMGKYSSFHLDGSFSAPWTEPDMDLQARLRTIDLPPLTPYTDRYVGYILKSGHLDTDLDLTVTQGKLKAQTEVVVNRIEMNPVKEEDEQNANERLGIPVQTALTLLKDKNDDIKLSLPIEGDLNDPEFKISDIVLTVTGNALKKGVSAFYGPLGATILTGGLLPPGTFSLLGKVFKGATTLTFDPVIFEPLESALSEGHRHFLDQLGEKLAEKPDTRLILCGKVTRRDIEAMREEDFAALQGTVAPAPAGTVPPGAPAERTSADTDVDSAIAGTVLLTPPAGPPSLEEAPLTPEEKGRLIELAKQRALAVEDYLIVTAGLEASRLFVCYSDVEEEPGGPPPRVDLSI